MEDLLVQQLDGAGPRVRIAVGGVVAAIGVALLLDLDRKGLISWLPTILIVVGAGAIGSGVSMQRQRQRRKRTMAMIETRLPEFLAAAQRVRAEGGNLARYVQGLGIADLDVRRELLAQLDRATREPRREAVES
ncbi:MAG: hypothetical protein IPK26_11350 [Planctomycetes bacterium]|nr:hypothetical protein [Planctomycetota bacterium]